MARLESGESDGVWVYDLTRFSRKVAEGKRLVELAARGIRVWAMAGEYDRTTADGRRAFREAMVVAAAESDKISEWVKRGKLRRARKGRPINAARSYAMPGYVPRGKDWEPRAIRGCWSRRNVWPLSVRWCVNAAPGCRRVSRSRRW
jgi:site-specific DNA recombinase